MKTFKVDLDYESFLFDPQYDEQSSVALKTRKEFEYVFFLINEEVCALKNCREYQPDYLNSLKKLGFTIPQLNTNAKDALPWWGHHHNLEIERKLNSKLTSALLAKKNDWGFFQGAIVESVNEITDHLKKYPENERWILKHPHSFSGIGHYHFSKDQIDLNKVQLLLKEKMLLEPRYERIFDIGTTFIVSNGEIQSQFMVENYNSGHGAFRGGCAASSLDNFKKHIQTKYNFDLTALDKITQQVVNEYLEMGAVSNVQIDSFVFSENGELKLYPLVEVNYRKTMGLVLYSLAKKFAGQGPIEWLIFSKKEFQELTLSPEYICLSPQDTQFKSYLKLPV